MFTAEKARLAECGNTSRVCATVRNFSKELGLGQIYDKEYYTSTEIGAKLELPAAGKEVIYLFFWERGLILKFHQWNHA